MNVYKPASKNTKSRGGASGKFRFKQFTKCAKYLILLFLCVYACMMVISFEAHGHASQVPLPTIQDLIPITLNHFDYKYSYELFHSVNDKDNEAMQEQWETSHFPFMNDYGGDYASDLNQEQGKTCRITVVFVDADFPNHKTGDPSLFALESIAAFFPDACIVIQTSICTFHNALPIAEEMNLSVEQSAYLRIYTMVEEETHDMMGRGQVRVTFLDHEKYNLKACDDFSNFSNALLNVNYWMDELNDRDSSNVMVVREGMILCHHFDIDNYREYAFVAAPLPSNDSKFGSFEYCSALRDLWKKSNVMRTASSPLDERNAMANILQSCLEGIGPMSMDESLVFVNRERILEAIRSCPHENYSGLDDMDGEQGAGRSCLWRQDDSSLYFSTILAAMGARLPTGVVASLLSTNRIWPEQALESYGGPFFNYNRQVLASKYNCIYKGASVTTINGRVEKRTVPISLHVPLHSDDEYDISKNQELLSHDVVEQCPFLKYVL